MVRSVRTRADRRLFVDLPYRLYQDDPNWVPPLLSDTLALIKPGKNGWLSHANAQLFVATENGRVVGRISAHIGTRALQMPAHHRFGPTVGYWGLMEAEREEVFDLLLAIAEAWLHKQGMTRALGPIGMSFWKIPDGHVDETDLPPTLLGDTRPDYRRWIERAGYHRVKQFFTYDLDITRDLPPIVQHIIASGRQDSRIKIRSANRLRLKEEKATIHSILNNSLSDSLDIVPFTRLEVEQLGGKLHSLILDDLVRIAELDGVPVAFMIAFPNLNEVLVSLKGRLLPFGWAKMLLWLRSPKARTVRVPLLGVVKELQKTQIASQLVFMMIEDIRSASFDRYGATCGEIGWILEDNQEMRWIAETMNSRVNKIYNVYSKNLGLMGSLH
jgi:hypothetical protein